MHLSAGLTAASLIFEPFGEIGANFPVQLSSRTQCVKTENKKVIAENQCEKHRVLESEMLAPAFHLHPYFVCAGSKRL